MTGPVAPPGAGEPIPTGRQTIRELLPESKGQLGEVARLWFVEGISSPTAIADAGGAANSGAASTLMANIRAIESGDLPTAPSKALAALGATRSFLKQHRQHLSPSDVTLLEGRITQLLEKTENRQEQAAEEAGLKERSEDLEKALEAHGGVYVYTYPHYFRYPTVEGTARTLLKVGMTTKAAADRVHQQARSTAVPEDPVILRVYQSTDRDPRALEREFHLLLDAADHGRSGSATGGKEWFETSLQFLDAVARVLGLTVVSSEEP